VLVAGRRLGAGVAVVAVLAAVLGLTAWWSWVDRAPEAYPVASVQGATVDRSAAVDPGLAESVRSSVSLVEASGCGASRQATTTLIDQGDGAVALTNEHVVAGAATARFTGPDGRSARARVRSRVPDRDAVHLSTGDLLAAGLRPLAVGPRPVQGAAVLVAGYPSGGFDARTGRVVRVEQRHGYGGTTDMLIIDVEAIPGISGGVVVDAEGRAVGLVAARDPETGDTVAYPLDTLDDATVPPELSCDTDG
jgi:S1-C subfamily serine protease